jgi:hypothetical protein
MIASATVSTIISDRTAAYQKRGYLASMFGATRTRQKFLDTLCEIRDGRIRDGFYFKDRPVSFRRDFLPSAYEYSDVFLDILAENGIPELVNRAAGVELNLVNIAIVDSRPPGYFTSWHSDNFEKPIHKLIFYPRWSEVPRNRLQILEGHIRPVTGSPLDIGYRWRSNRYFNAIEPKLFFPRIRSIYSSDDYFVFVNTQTLHRAYDVADASGALRILYSFRERFQSHDEKLRYVAISDQTTLEHVNEVGKRYDAIAGARAR